MTAMTTIISGSRSYYDIATTIYIEYGFIMD